MKNIKDKILKLYGNRSLFFDFIINDFCKLIYEAIIILTIEDYQLLPILTLIFFDMKKY